VAVVYILVAVAVLCFMITVHELGHYLAAKALKFRVNEFAIGFGKALFKYKKKNGEVISIRMVPLGGFCSFEGEDEAGSPGADHSAARAVAPDGTEYTPFSKMAPWKRLVVLFCGPFANFICAIVFSFILMMAIGYHQEVKVTEMNPASHYATVLKSDDVLVGINGKKFTLLKNYQSRTGEFGLNEEFSFMVMRDGNLIDVTVAKHEIIQKDGVKKWSIGIEDGEISYVKLGFGAALGKAFKFSLELAWLVLSFLGKMVTGQVALSQMGGTFATISVLSQSVSYGMINLLIMIPLISANLAIFNLLPIPALDGARMVFVFIEWIRGKPINPAIENRIHNIGLLILLGLIVFLDLNYLVFQRLF